MKLLELSACHTHIHLCLWTLLPPPFDLYYMQAVFTLDYLKGRASGPTRRTKPVLPFLILMKNEWIYTLKPIETPLKIDATLQKLNLNIFFAFWNERVNLVSYPFCNCTSPLFCYQSTGNYGQLVCKI